MTEIKIMLFGKFKKKYHYIMSIGQGCTTPQVLKDIDYRGYTSPFDWTWENNYKSGIGLEEWWYEAYYKGEFRNGKKNGLWNLYVHYSSYLFLQGITSLALQN